MRKGEFKEDVKEDLKSVIEVFVLLFKLTKLFWVVIALLIAFELIVQV